MLLTSCLEDELLCQSFQACQIRQKLQPTHVGGLAGSLTGFFGHFKVPVPGRGYVILRSASTLPRGRLTGGCTALPVGPVLPIVPGPAPEAEMALAACSLTTALELPACANL